MLRYSLRTLAVVVTLSAVACGALMNASPWIASTATTLLIIGLAFATVAAVLARRCFWVGFAIVGWAYLFVAMGPMDSEFKGTLWTTVALQKASAVAPQAAMSVQPPAYSPYASYPTTTYQPVATPTIVTVQPGPVSTYAYTVTTRVPDFAFVQAFQQIGHALFTLLFALAGGLFATLVAVRKQSPHETSRNP